MPNLPAPIRPTVTGRFCDFAFEQQGVEVHASRFYTVPQPRVPSPRNRGERESSARGSDLHYFAGTTSE